MIVFRALLLLLLIAAMVCFGLYVGTGERRWLRLGLAIVKWTLIAAFGFLAVLLLERMAA